MDYIIEMIEESKTNKFLKIKLVIFFTLTRLRPWKVNCEARSTVLQM